MVKGRARVDAPNALFLPQQPGVYAHCASPVGLRRFPVLRPVGRGDHAFRAEGEKMARKLWVVAAALAPVAAALLATPAHADSSPATISDTSLTATSTTIGGATVLPTTRTVAHWWGSTLDPSNGVTYGYNMVGADPNNCSGSACSTTIPVDIIPVNVNVGGRSFNGTDTVAATLASPQFATDDYTTTSRSTSASGGFTNGGPLSAGNVGVQLQDATMRSQFNKVGDSPYHVILAPVVHPAITIDVPSNQGTLLRSARGVVFADVSISWWAAQLQNQINGLGYMDATHLPIFLTNEVMLHVGKDIFNCCVIGFHGAGIVPGRTNGSGNGDGNQPVQTYAWASYVTPGTFNPTADWALQDIHPLSHEVAEWADDPFVNNWVEPWLTPTAPQYGCTNILETGDPVVGIGFSKGTNTFEQGPAPNGQQIADGTYHPEDEVFLPWFMRSAPNTISQPTQTPSANIGRYTLMGDLNPYAGFRAPATGC
jgi:hypothetical protein